MNILLRILVILTLVLNGVAFWFTYALYGKRELLKDRNDRFESFTIEIAKTLEGAQPEQTEDDKAALAEMPVIDMESTDAEHAGKALTDLEVRSFWTEGEGGYHIEYESTPEFYKGPEPKDLEEVYVLDAEKKAKLDSRGKAITTGSKMDVALNEIVAKSEAQRDYYTKVRGQLTALREEYEALVPQIHTLKEESRQRAQTIIDRDNTISGLEADKANLEGQVADRDQQIASLEEEKSVLQGDLDAVTEERDTLADEVENLKKTLAMSAQSGQRANPNPDGVASVAHVTARVNGTLARGANHHHLPIRPLTPAALNDLLCAAGDRPLPEIDFLVSRPGKKDAIVGKIKVRTLVKDQSPITCDIPADWKQDAIQQGDEVFYLD